MLLLSVLFNSTLQELQESLCIFAAVETIASMACPLDDVELYRQTGLLVSRGDGLGLIQTNRPVFRSMKY